MTKTMRGKKNIYKIFKINMNKKINKKNCIRLYFI